MAKYLSPMTGQQFIDANGNPYSGAKLFTYVAGTSTKVTVYKDSAGASSHDNPIILNTRGEPADGSGAAMPIWQEGGANVKFVLAPSTDTDPPVSAIDTFDNIPAINDVSSTVDQWVAGTTPTYISATSFSLAGDLTSTYHVGRRIKASVTAGTVYGSITASSYATSITTVTVSLDSGNLDSGMSAVSYGLLTATYPALPTQLSNQFTFTNASPFVFEGTTADAYETTIAVADPTADRTITIPDLTGTISLTSPVSGSARNLSGSRTTAAQVTITADELVLKNSSGMAVLVSSLSAIADLSLSGVSGLDTGAEASGTDYAIWALRKTSPISAASVTVDNTTDIITHTAHGMAANTPIQVAGSVVPTGLSASTTYYIRDVTTDTYKVAATPGGSAINITSNGTSVTVTEHPALVFSTSSSAPTLPTGYTFYAMASSCRNDGSSNILNFYQRRNEIFYTTEQSVLNGGAATSSTQITISGFVPSFAKTFKAFVSGRSTSASEQRLYFGVESGVNARTLFVGSAAYGAQDNSCEIELPNVSQGFYYNFAFSSGDGYALITGYTI